MAFPPVRTFIGIPYAVTPTLLSGVSYRAIYWPLDQLTDGFAKTAWRCANTTGAVQLDLGSAKPLNFLVVTGHNFDADIIAGVTLSNSVSMSPAILTRGVGVKQPAFWLDLRQLSGAPTTARYVSFAFAGNSRPVTIHELSVGLASEFNGVLAPEPSEKLTFPQERTTLEYGKVAISAMGSLTRTMDLRLILTPTDRAAFDAIHAAAVTSPLAYPGTGTRVVVVPSTHRNDAWFVEWPGYVEQTFEESDRVVEMPLTLVEEVVGVS